MGDEHGLFVHYHSVEPLVKQIRRSSLPLTEAFPSILNYFKSHGETPI